MSLVRPATRLRPSIALGISNTRDSRRVSGVLPRPHGVDALGFQACVFLVLASKPRLHSPRPTSSPAPVTQRGSYYPEWEQRSQARVRSNRAGEERCCSWAHKRPRFRQDHTPETLMRRLDEVDRI